MDSQLPGAIQGDSASPEGKRPSDGRKRRAEKATGPGPQAGVCAEMRPEQTYAAVWEFNKIHQRRDEKRIHGVKPGGPHNEKALLREMIAVFL